MTEKDQPIIEDEQSTPQDDRSLEDTSEIDDLFSEEEETIDDLFSEEEETKEETKEDVEALKKRLQEMEKGIKKLASQLGRQKTTPQTAAVSSTIAEELLLARYPEAENVMDEIKKAAQETGKDPLTIFKSSQFLQKEAKARLEAKQAEEEAKAKVNSPSSSIGPKGDIPFNQIDLTNKEHLNWLKAKKGRMESYKSWLIKNN